MTVNTSGSQSIYVTVHAKRWDKWVKKIGYIMKIQRLRNLRSEFEAGSTIVTEIWLFL